MEHRHSRARVEECDGGGFSMLPNESVHYILSFLPFTQRIHARRVSRGFEISNADRALKYNYEWVNQCCTDKMRR